MQVSLNHIIRPGDAHGVKIGFTVDRFDGWLWREGDSIVIHLVISRSPRTGNLSAMVDAILAQGLTVKVPNPIGPLSRFVRKHGFIPTITPDDKAGRVPVWTKYPGAKP